MYKVGDIVEIKGEENLPDGKSIYASMHGEIRALEKHEYSYGISLGYRLDLDHGREYWQDNDIKGLGCSKQHEKAKTEKQDYEVGCLVVVKTENFFPESSPKREMAGKIVKITSASRRPGWRCDEVEYYTVAPQGNPLWGFGRDIRWTNEDFVCYADEYKEDRD